jgi:hypothetical protein
MRARNDSSRAAPRAAATLAAALIALAPAAARADDKRDTYSPYEQQTIDRALKKTAGVIEPHPEGMIIEGVDVITLDVFEDRDPLPAVVTPIANWFHATSRKYVIEREVLLAPGERWQQALVDETARNLRGLDQLSLVLCVPLRGGAPGRVRLLVITKDVWSLRLNSNYRFADGRLQYLLLQPSEENLLGTHQQILGNFVLDPATISVGGQYIIPRVAGSRIRATASANAIINRETGRAEGTYGSVSYESGRVPPSQVTGGSSVANVWPLYSTHTKWGWGASLSWDQEIVRRFIAGLPTDFDPESGKCAIPVTDAGTLGPANGKRCQYKRDSLSGAFSVTRSFGTTFKHDLSIGVSASRKQYRTLDLSALTPDQQKAFASAFMPVSDNQTGPFVEYHDYSARYFEILDYESLGLTENIQRGHDLTLRVSPVLRAFNSTRDFVSVVAAASYTVPLGDGFVRAALSSDTEITTSGVPDGSWSASLRVVTPRFGHGRLVFSTTMLDRYNNYLNAKTTLGGDGRLRGYPAAMFIGKDYAVANLEYRSDPIEIAAVQLGFVMFADAGDAFDGWSQMHLKQSAGFGLRAVFPQLQRSAMRIDLGFPLTQDALPAGQGHADVVVTFGQAF